MHIHRIKHSGADFRTENLNCWMRRRKINGSPFCMRTYGEKNSTVNQKRFIWLHNLCWKWTMRSGFVMFEGAVQHGLSEIDFKLLLIKTTTKIGDLYNTSCTESRGIIFFFSLWIFCIHQKKSCRECIRLKCTINSKAEYSYIWLIK